MAVTPRDLDVGTLALFAGQACADGVQRELARRGFDDVRFSHGYVFQHLIDAGRTISELAGRLDVSQQAASKTVAELVHLGYVELSPDAEDARQKQVQLTRRGRAVIAAARKARAEQEARLERRLGASRLTQCRRFLTALLEELGGTEAVRSRRVRAPR